MFDRNLGENFAVDFDFILFEGMHEGAVFKAFFGDCGVYTHDPEAPEVAFAAFAAVEGVLAGVKGGLFCFAEQRASAHPVAFGLL